MICGGDIPLLLSDWEDVSPRPPSPSVGAHGQNYEYISMRKSG